jgi:RNA polymerase sigma-70 factor (ECF subfamily)
MLRPAGKKFLPMTDAALSLIDEIAHYRPMLYRLALLQLRDKAAAADATQETMLAALEGAPGFRAQSSPKTWLFAILRHKVIDSLRARARHVPLPGEGSDAELDVTNFATLFDAEGCWAAAKDIWADPETVVERLAFFRVLEACLTRLPPRTARAFLMREWLELAPDEVSAELKVSAGNLRVLLYRARMQLRLCLDLGWNRAG